MRASSFVSEPITVLDTSFDPAGMALGEPGLPHKFRWRKKAYEVSQVLEKWREFGDCTHNSGERYVRKHSYRVRTSDSTVFHLYFQRTFGRGKFRMRHRWCVFSVESPDTTPPPGT